MDSNALIRWYRASARRFPWRESTDPYRVLVSEIMLQQTVASAVVPKFTEFVRRFPTREALAAATDDELFSAWEGLGYYRRAMNIREACRADVPDSFSGLMTLRGVGIYTAAAVASIAFGEPVAAVDGNVRRVLARVIGSVEVGTRLDAACRAASEQAMRPHSPGEWNQALMELGAVVCRPRNPKCGECPLAADCVARRTDRIGDLPRRSEPMPPKAVVHVCVCPVRGMEVGVRRIAEGKWWIGLWGFPRVDAEPDEPPASALMRLGFPDAAPLCHIRHRVTNHDVTLHAYVAESEESGLSWHPVDALERVPLPSPQRRVARILAARLSP